MSTRDPAARDGTRAKQFRFDRYLLDLDRERNRFTAEDVLGAVLPRQELSPAGVQGRAIRRCLAERCRDRR